MLDVYRKIHARNACLKLTNYFIQSSTQIIGSRICLTELSTKERSLETGTPKQSHVWQNQRRASNCTAMRRIRSLSRQRGSKGRSAVIPTDMKMSRTYVQSGNFGEGSWTNADAGEEKMLATAIRDALHRLLYCSLLNMFSHDRMVWDIRQKRHTIR